MCKSYMINCPWQICDFFPSVCVYELWFGFSLDKTLAEI